MNSRYDTFKKFKKYKQGIEKKTISQLCDRKNIEFELQSQQYFLKDYFKNNFNDIKQFLLYHEIGSGKTCTSIALAEDFLKLESKNKIIVILPARLKNNFYDELITPCTYFKYFNKDDYLQYINSDTSIKNKEKLREKFIKQIDEKYTIISYERFRLDALKHSENILEYINDFSKNAMIIIDEVHNLISDSYPLNTYINIENTGKIPINVKSLSINSTLLKLLSKYSHDSCKLLYLTATPIYDSFKELPELVYILNPEKNNNNIEKVLTNASINDNIEKLRGKISYFPGTSKKAYPTPKIITHILEMSKIQDEMTYTLEVDDNSNENEKEAFLSYQRQISVSCLSKKYKLSKIIANLELYSPKIYKLFNILKSPDIYGKHVVYSSFINVGINVIEKVLIDDGWISIFKVYKDPEKWKNYENKVYAIWSGNESNKKKNIIKQYANDINNIYGNKIKLIIGSPSIKEGISFKHIQHIHLLDPVWNMSGKKQIEGRAIRFCSHYDINEKVHKNLKRSINIHIYKLKLNKNAKISETVDEKLYNKIIPDKYKEVEILENELKKISIDYHLFKKMYKTDVISPSSSMGSNISIDNIEKIVKKKKKTASKNTCNPKKRRPNKITKNCNEEYPIKRKNKKGDNCCYKLKKEEKNKTTCPTNRIPDENGNCKNGLFKRKNKQGYECCYKYNK
jgi:hypothetical protein